MEPTIIFEDETLLAVDKPSGLVVHADGRTKEPTLADWVLARYPDLKDVGGLHTLDTGRYTERAGILHRLDRETSGIILIAKNDETFYFLQRQFLEHSIEKIYHAFVLGVPEPGKGTIDLPIGRSKSDFRRFVTGEDARGNLRKAVTRYETKQENGAYAFVELAPSTGRTHQLRVHMKAIGHPIIADGRYGTEPALGISRVALHASTLSFTTKEGKRMTLAAPYPEDFLAALEKMR
jgi:23S rRNA pseudouridine1911/1915/1917 synthase